MRTILEALAKCVPLFGLQKHEKFALYDAMADPVLVVPHYLDRPQPNHKLVCNAMGGHISDITQRHYTG